MFLERNASQLEHSVEEAQTQTSELQKQLSDYQDQLADLQRNMTVALHMAQSLVTAIPELRELLVETALATQKLGS